MKSFAIAIVSALVLVGCSSMRNSDNADNGAAMGTSGANTPEQPITGIGASSNGQPYGTPSPAPATTGTPGSSGMR